MPDLAPVGTVTPEEKAKVVEVLTTSEAKAAIMDAIRPNSIDVTELETVGTLNGKSLPILDDAEKKLKSYPFLSLQNVMGDMVAATTSANEAASAANSAKLDCDAAAAEASQAAEDAASDTAEAISAMNSNVANAIAEIEETISNLDVIPTNDIGALATLLVNNGLAYKITQNKEHSTSTNDTTIVAPNAAFSSTYVVNEGSVIYEAIVTMGGTDISSTAITNINDKVCWISIPSVTGNVVITIVATKPIIFEDSNTKAICVENWGGNYIEGEITEHEASVVTTLNNAFKGNTTFAYFNEFRYFTGLTSLEYSTLSSYAAGQFYNCDGLLEITFPTLKVGQIQGLFRQANKIEHVDLTPIKAATIYTSCLCREANWLEDITFPYSCKVGGGAHYLFRACPNLKTINFNNTIWTSVNSYLNAFYNCTQLVTITGNPIGFSLGLDFGYSSKLTRDSIMVIINGLYDFVGHGSATTQNLKLHSTALGRLTEDDIEIATNKGWTVTA